MPFSVAKAIVHVGSRVKETYRAPNAVLPLSDSQAALGVMTLEDEALLHLIPVRPKSL